MCRSCRNLQTYIENLVRKAHLNWSTLHEFEGLVNDTALLTQGISFDTQTSLTKSESAISDIY